MYCIIIWNIFWIIFQIAIAAVAGSSVYIYKNRKLFYKYSLPSLEVIQIERDLWAAYYKALSESVCHLINLQIDIPVHNV